MRLLFVRHGETDWNASRRCQGHTDIPLNAQGMAQAEKLGQFLKDISLGAIYASDLSRAMQTAQEIARHHSLNVHKLSKLRERSYGEWEGLTLEQIAERFPDQLHVRREGGQYGIELFADLQERVFASLTELAAKHTGETIVAVSHGGSINAFLHRITDGKLGTGVTKIGNTSVTRIDYDKKDGWRVVDVNQMTHLESVSSHNT